MFVLIFLLKLFFVLFFVKLRWSGLVVKIFVLIIGCFLWLRMMLCIGRLCLSWMVRFRVLILIGGVFIKIGFGKYLLVMMWVVYFLI